MVKAHNFPWEYNGRPLVHLECTVGAIYIVRNVFDVTVSIARHFDHEGIALKVRETTPRKNMSGTRLG